jgi:hypothetical protein
MKNLFQLLPIIFLFNISCQSSKEEKIVKTITTTFSSHQTDTEQKDDKIVAVAKFDIDGSINEFTQHLTYPYDYAEPQARKFWQSPIQKNVPLIMDGLDLSHAEKNFLYGNDWPKVYAAMIEKDGHPRRPKSREMYNAFKSFITYQNNSIPLEIDTKRVISEKSSEYDKSYLISSLAEKFDYENKQIVRYGVKSLENKELFEKMLMEELKPKSKAEYDNIKRKLKEIDTYSNVDFKYDGALLTSVLEGNKKHKFIYENEGLIKTEYYVNDKLYNQRYFYLNEDGSKSRTELFNIDNEPEYTIKYNYEFFESQT